MNTRKSESLLQSWNAAEKSALIQIEQQYMNKNQSRMHMLPTGFVDLDKAIGGCPSGLTVIAGRPNHNSDNLQRNIVENNLSNFMESSTCVLHFELDHPRGSYVKKLLSSMSRVDMKNIEQGELIDEDWARVASSLGLLREFNNLRLYENPTLFVEDIESMCNEALSTSEGIGIISISSLDSLSTYHPYTSRSDEKAYICRYLKNIALNFNTYVVITTGVESRVERRKDKSPKVSDIKCIDSIEDYAELILVCNRDDDYLFLDSTEIIIGKAKKLHIGSVRLSYQKQFVRLDGYPELI